MPRRTLVALFTTLLAVLAGCSPTPKKEQILEMEGAKWKVTKGTWDVEGDGLRGHGGVLQGLEEIEDGILELDVELQYGPPETWAGVEFRYNAPEGKVDKYNGYGIHFNWAGSYKIVRGVAGQSTELTTTPPKLEGFGPKMIHLVITMSQSSFAVSVDGMSRVSFDDENFRKGAIRFWVDSPASIVSFRQVHLVKP